MCSSSSNDQPVQITVREISHNADSSFTVEVHGTTADSHLTPIPVSSPFTTPLEDQELQWYCETADQEPFSVSPRLQRVEQSMRSYGTALYHQVFSHPHTTLPTGIVITIRIVGSPRFSSLHWELLQDPKRGPVALDPERCLVRAVPTHIQRNEEPHRLLTYPTLNVLFLTARHRISEKDIPLRIESLAVMDSVRDYDLPLRFDLVRPGTLTALVEKLQQVKPGFYHILHLDCHGANNCFGQSQSADADCNRLVFETERADYTTVSADDIAEVVDMFKIPVVLTSACRSAMSKPDSPSFAYELFSKSNVQCVVAMALSVLVDTTARFVRHFYRAMMDVVGKQTVRSSMRTARQEMCAHPQRNGVQGMIKRQDWWLPQIFERSLPCPQHTGRFFKCSWEDAASRAHSREDKELIWEESELHMKRKTLLVTEAVDEKTFLGRNEDLRMLECKVFSHDRGDNVILLYGIMGIGKTAFIRYVSWWWCVTGLVRDKFVFRMHERSFTLNSMIWHIYRQIFNVQNYNPTNASATQIQEDRRRVTEHLRRYCYVIVIDSAERLCTQEEQKMIGFEPLRGHYESEFESDSEDKKVKAEKAGPRTRVREQIAKWLAELQGGRTVVLIGFRGSSESDLMKFIEHKSNKLDLATIVGKYPSRKIANLSPKWSEALVKQILDETGDSSDPKYAPLYSYPMLDLYAGNPLVIKLMMASFRSGEMAHPSYPEDLDERLQKHLANPSESMSVMTSLEYSFNMLSAPQKEALCFLAPFKSSVTTEGLRHYADALEEDPQCSSFDRQAWDLALQMAVRWGLLTQHERIRRYHNQNAWRIHACLSALLVTKLYHKRASESRGELDDLPSDHEYSILEHVDEEAVLRPMLKPMHAAYWKWALQLFDFLSSSDKDINDGGRVLTEIDFWNLKRALRYALEEKLAFYGLLLPMYWYLAAKNDITQRYALCRRTVEKIGTYERFEDIPAVASVVYRLDIPRAYHMYGMLLGHNRLHRINEAEEWFLRTKKIWKACGDKSEQAVTEHELGWVASNKREYENSRQHYMKALELSDRLGKSRTLYNLGLLAAQEENYKDAVQYQEEAIALYEEQKDERAIASAYHHMAIAFSKINAFEQADYCAKKALTRRKEREETEQTANVYQLRGNIAQRRARQNGITAEESARYMAIAKKTYDKAMISYNCDKGYHFGVIPEREMLHENYGLMMATQRRFMKSARDDKEMLRTEMDSYLRVKHSPFPKALYNLGLLYEELGQHEKAYGFYCRAADLRCTVTEAVEEEACRRAHVAKARCLANGRGVAKDEHEAVTIMLRLRGELPDMDTSLSILEGKG